MLTGKEVRARRLGLGMSVQDLAEKTYLSKQTILNIENKEKVSKSTLYLLELVTDKLYENYSVDEKEKRILLGTAGFDLRLFKKEVVKGFIKNEGLIELIKDQIKKGVI